MSIPSYALYGENIAPAETWIHWETITSRSRLYGFRIAPHRHEQLVQLLFIAGGRAGVVLDDATRDVIGPTLLIIPPIVVHGFEFSDDINGHVLTFFARDLLELLADAPRVATLLDTPGILDLSDTDLHGTAVASAVQDLVQEGQHTGPGQGLALKGRAALLLAQVYRAALLVERKADVKSKRSEAIARAFQSAVDQQYGTTRNIGDYAKGLGISPTHLNRICNQIFGTSALNVIERRIILEAQRYLQFSVLSIKEIAFLLGYPDAAYFSRFFRRHVGMTPQTYRDRSSLTD